MLPSCFRLEWSTGVMPHMPFAQFPPSSIPAERRPSSPQTDDEGRPYPAAPVRLAEASIATQDLNQRDRTRGDRPP